MEFLCYRQLPKRDPILRRVALFDRDPLVCGRPVASSHRRKQLDLMDESELFMELIRDVANELDIDVLCHKILVNVGLLTHADRGSLFLARGPRDARYLVAKLFDVTVDTGKKTMPVYISFWLKSQLHMKRWLCRSLGQCHRLCTATARIRGPWQFKCAICGGLSTGEDFIRVRWFP